MVTCLERGADLHIAQLMPLPLTVSCSSKIHLVPAYLGSPGKRAVKRVCVCVCCIWICEREVLLILYTSTSVEELVSRLLCSPLYSNIIMDYYWLLTLSVGGPRLTWPIFLNIPKKVVNVILQGELWPSYRGNLADVVNVFSEQRFPVTRKKAIFCKISKFYFQKVGQGTVTKKFSLTGLGCPRIMIAKIWPWPENLAKMWCKFWGWSPSGGLGKYCRGRLKTGKGVHYRTLWRTK